ncbi:hypothetical protein [Methylobacterium aquaticum]|uniref:hypothetical protein n=1 Tax=Methylobacterium aquaticum TaxID=270351 RepID=UPI001932A9DC|nr:hypothetical protein [Methylobacterium aquaticum]QRE78292.1 hypothetical protein F1D61_33245 [Methylobacterium aquaticum]QRE78322.1 hypothetical protein F1D61_33435 [Methylobacterium aquaticum]
MEPDPLQAALARFAADLTIAGEPAVFDRVVERHLDLLLNLQAKGLRWPRVLKLLKQAGARRSDGADLSPDQLRTSISRAKRRRTALVTQPLLKPSRPPAISQVGQNSPIRSHRSDARDPDKPVADEPSVFQPRTTAFAKHRVDIIDPDLSEAALDAVRRRLR